MERSVHSASARWLWVALFLFATIALLAGGYRYYQSEADRIRTEKYEELAAIAKLKVGQIEQWRKERLGDISRYSEASFFVRRVRQWLRDKNNTVLQTELQERMALEQKKERYADVLLFDPEGNVLLSAESHPHPLSPSAKEDVEQALANRTPILSDLYRCPKGIVHLDAVGPIFDAEGRPIAVLVLRSNAESHLYPLIQSWPTPSRTAETLLVRRDGDGVLFLNDLRHRPNSALSLREPLTDPDLPAVRAVLGKEGEFLGKDYREVEVLADLRPIPNSPWFMVAKVDASEILAEARYRGGIIALFAALFVVLAASVTAYGYRRRQVRLYRELYQSERDMRLAQEEFRTTLYSIGDAVITTDTRGLVKQMNRAAERFTGRQEAEVQGKPIGEVFRIVNEETRAVVEDPVARVLRDGLVVGLANHTVLITRDGSELPIADSGAPIRDRSGVITGVVLVFQDQSEGRRLLRERETRLTLLRILHEQNDTREMVRHITGFLQKRTGCEAVGVRLKDGDDFPYFETRGFPQEFVLAENSLCSRDATGQVLRDSTGCPVLECMCGNVLNGRFDPSLPFFTAKGSFWSNCTTELLASATEDSQWRLPNRCNSEGYESVALFSLRSGEETFGLLQLNDRAKDRFTSELLEFMESTADQIANALARRQAATQLRESEERYRSLFDNMLEGYVYCEMIFEDGRPKDFIYLEANPAFEQLTGLKNVVGKRLSEVMPGVRERDPEVLEIHGRVSLTGIPEKFEAYVDSLGSWYSASVYSPKKGYFISVFDNITERKRAEEALERRIIALTQPLDVTEGIAFEDLFDLKEIQNLQDQFARASNVASIITNPDGTPITRPSNFCRLCDEIIRKTEKGVENCYYSDSVIGRYNPDGPTVQPCLSGGLWDAGTSISVGGRHIANWLIGQVRNEAQEADTMRKYAREIGVDEEIFLQAFHEVPSMSKEQFTSVARALYTLAGHLSTMAYQNVQQARFIADRKKAEEALKVSEERHRAIFESAAIGIHVVSDDSRFLQVNDAFSQMIGYSKDELTNMTFLGITHPEDVEVSRALHDKIKVRATDSYRFEKRYIRKDGTIMWADVSVSAVRQASGSHVATIGVILDITERKQAEQEREILQGQLFQAQKMEAVGTLAGGVAHDFNNLLQVVSGYSELILSEENLPAAYKADLEKILQASRGGADLVQRLLTFSRKTEAKPRPLNLNRRIEQLQKMLSRTIPKMIEMELLLADDLAAINADPTQMEQVLMNLAVNARDAMPEGGTLSIKTENVTLDEDYCRTHLEAKPGRYVLLSVSDTGEGMDKETVQHIFEPFFTTKGVGEGTGLGLAVVYGIVKQHAGHIMCYSEPTRGTVFRMYFPALVSDEEQRELLPRALPPGGAETILIVDDEELIRDLGARILTKAGYTVMTASNGKKALDLYQENRDEISLVILDLIMPEMGGKQCLDGLLLLDPSVKVVIASGYSANATTKEALNSGAKGFVNKPYDMRQVLEVVRSVLDEP